MDGLLNKNEVVCCFCGNSLSIEEAVILNVQPNIESEESQTLFSHKEHFIKALDKTIMLYPDFFEDDENS